MKRKSMKQMFAIAMSVAMVMGMPMVAMATDTTNPDSGADDTTTTTENKAEVEAPIYSFDVTNVVVPTSLVVAFNPDKLTIKTGADAGDTSTAQVLSKNFGILNKSNKDKLVTVTLKVEDLNDGKISFVDTDALATGASEGQYAVHLAVVPADDSEVKVGTASADKATTAAAIADVEMTPATANAVTLEEGNNTIAFVLQKGTYTTVSGKDITLGDADAENNVLDNLELNAVATGGKGITAFTFVGALNEKADWSKLSKGIKITAIYNFETTYDYDTLTAADGGSVVDGTGAMVDEIAPKFMTGSIGVINFNAGVGDVAFAQLVSVSAPWEGKPTNITKNATVDADAGTITISGVGGWAQKEEDPTLTIVYKNAGGEDVTATVTLKTH